MKILYEGVDIYPDVSVHRCYHDMYAEKQSDELLLKLNDTRELWDSWNPKKGDTIAIEDGAAKTGKMFVESVVPESGIITLRAYSVPQSAKDKRSKSWEKVKFLQLAQEIAGRHGLTLETYGITDQTYDYIEQNNLADFAFFQNRCTLEGAAFLVYDGKLVVYDEAYMESQQPVDTITITPANDFEYRDEGANAYGSAEAVNGGLTGTFAAPNGGDKVLRRILPFRMTDQSEADRFAKGLLRDANKRDRRHPLDGLTAARLCGGSVVTLATEGVSRGTARPSSAGSGTTTSRRGASYTSASHWRDIDEQQQPNDPEGQDLQRGGKDRQERRQNYGQSAPEHRRQHGHTAADDPVVSARRDGKPDPRNRSRLCYVRGRHRHHPLPHGRRVGRYRPGRHHRQEGRAHDAGQGISVPSADVIATGISLTGHTHTDSMGGGTSGPQ